MACHMDESVGLLSFDRRAGEAACDPNIGLVDSGIGPTRQAGPALHSRKKRNSGDDREREIGKPTEYIGNGAWPASDFSNAAIVDAPEE